MRRRTLLALLTLAAPLLASACASNKDAMPSAYAPTTHAMNTGAAPSPESARASLSSPPSKPSAPSSTSAGQSGAKSASDGASHAASHAASTSMLIYTGALQMLTEEANMSATLDRVIDAAESVGGHIASRTDTSVVIKVPSARFREAFTMIEPLGMVTHRSVAAEDVTDQYHDAEVRLQNLKATRQRMQDFLARAANIPDTLTVERELERVAQEIDVLEGRMHFLKERAAFSEIRVTVEPKPKPPILKEPPPPPPPPPSPKRLLDLPVEWFTKLGVNRLLDLR
jgi:hypothetical protein